MAEPFTFVCEGIHVGTCGTIGAKTTLQIGDHIINLGVLTELSARSQAEFFWKIADELVKASDKLSEKIIAASIKDNEKGCD